MRTYCSRKLQVADKTFFVTGNLNVAVFLYFFVWVHSIILCPGRPLRYITLHLLKLINDHLQNSGNGQSYWDRYNMFLVRNEENEWCYIYHHLIFLLTANVSSQRIFINSVSRSSHHLSSKC